MDKTKPMGGLRSYFPILDWLPPYKSEWLRFDMIAAFSVWALLVPQGIAYSSIAGVPAQSGLYAGPGSLLGVLRMGWISHFLSGAVLGAVVIDAGISLVKIKEFQHYCLSTRDSAALLATALAVFFVGVLVGVIAGVAV